MVDELDALGCTSPVLPGIMPAVNVAGLRRMAGMNGTDLPAAMMERLDAAADDDAEVAKIGVEVATELGAALRDAGAPGLHLYAMNRSSSVLAVYANLHSG